MNTNKNRIAPKYFLGNISRGLLNGDLMSNVYPAKNVSNKTHYISISYSGFYFNAYIIFSWPYKNVFNIYNQIIVPIPLNLQHLKINHHNHPLLAMIELTAYLTAATDLNSFTTIIIHLMAGKWKPQTRKCANSRSKPSDRHFADCHFDYS